MLGSVWAAIKRRAGALAGQAEVRPCKRTCRPTSSPSCLVRSVTSRRADRRGPRYRREPSKAKPHTARASPQQWYNTRSAPLDCRRLPGLTFIVVIADQVVSWSPDYSANPEGRNAERGAALTRFLAWSLVWRVRARDCLHLRLLSEMASRFCETRAAETSVQCGGSFDGRPHVPRRGAEGYLRVPRPSTTRCWPRASPTGFVHIPWDLAQ